MRREGYPATGPSWYPGGQSLKIGHVLPWRLLLEFADGPVMELKNSRHFSALLQQSMPDVQYCVSVERGNQSRPSCERVGVRKWAVVREGLI
jgi:hypothetical protein